MSIIDVRRREMDPFRCPCLARIKGLKVLQRLKSMAGAASSLRKFSDELRMQAMNEQKNACVMS
jgi:hypothetical protein